MKTKLPVPAFPNQIAAQAPCRSDREADAPGAQQGTLGQLQDKVNRGPKVRALAQLQSRINASPQQIAQRKMAGALTQPAPAPQQAANRTGLPDSLKSGLEQLSGFDLSGVRVSRNSSKPAQLRAHAYAQGNTIELGPGQDRHLPHEGWHVVQQMQGRVAATAQAKGIPINDDKGLEAEADVMGAKAAQLMPRDRAPVPPGTAVPIAQFFAAQMLKGTTQLASVTNARLNVVGEEHPASAERLATEKAYSAAESGSASYWTEAQFRVRAYSVLTDWIEDKRAFADPFIERFNQSLAFLRENAVILKAHGDANLTTANHASQLDHESKFIGNLDTYLHNLGIDMDGFELPVLTKQTLLTRRAQINIIAATYEAARIELAGQRGLGAPAPRLAFSALGAAVTTEAHGRANLKKAVDDLVALHPVAAASVISTNRSQAMHVAANTRHAELGVWKIGDKHRGDMEGMVPMNYNLVSKDEFNNDLLEWQSEKMLGARDAFTGQRGGIGTFYDDDL